MPPKRASTAATKKAGTTAAAHSSYRDMIKDAIQNLKERNGSSRQSIKKYVQANNKINVASPAAFDAQFNKAIKAGVDKDEFTQPKGPSGPVKLAKKDAEAKPATKPAPKKATTTKAAPAKRGAPKKADKPAAKTTTKKASTTKKAAGRPKANTAKPRESSGVAPAVVEQPKVITKTKSGRVTKTNAKPEEKSKPATKKRGPPKKRT